MPPITALLHTHNDALRLGRTLETLYPCDDILIVDHASRDGSVQLGREYGARVLPAQPGASPKQYMNNIRPGWLLCLDPCESLTESLAATLFEWKSLPSDALPATAFSVFLREETAQGWSDVTTRHTRLVPQTWSRWGEVLPIHDPSAPLLEGELLRFVFP